MKLKSKYTFEITIVDKEKPVLILNEDALTIIEGEKFDVLNGVTATDNVDGNLTSKVVTNIDKLHLNAVGKKQLTYTVSKDAIKGLLTQKATLNNAVEIASYSTRYGTNTLYAEQQTGGRTGQAYGGYDYNSHPENAGIFTDHSGR